MKAIGGIGYIFSLIPFLNFVAPIMLGIAWYQMGSKTRQGVFKATGVLMILTLLITASFLAIFSAIFLPILTTAFTVGSMAGPDPSALISSMLGSLLVFIGGAVILGVLGLAVFILELVSHFRAGELYDNKWFRRAAWLRIIVVILVFVLIGVVFAAGGLAPASFESDIFLSAIFLPIIPLAVISLLSVVFSAVAFFTLQEDTPPPPA